LIDRLQRCRDSASRPVAAWNPPHPRCRRGGRRQRARPGRVGSPS